MFLSGLVRLTSQTNLRFLPLRHALFLEALCLAIAKLARSRLNSVISGKNSYFYESRRESRRLQPKWLQPKCLRLPDKAKETPNTAATVTTTITTTTILLLTTTNTGVVIVVAVVVVDIVVLAVVAVVLVVVVIVLW